MISLMCVNIKKTNKQNKQKMEETKQKKHTDAENRVAIIRGKGGSWEKGVKGLNSMMMNRNLTFEHAHCSVYRSQNMLYTWGTPFRAAHQF